MAAASGYCWSAGVLVVSADEAAMGSGWGVRLRKADGTPWDKRLGFRKKSLLIGLFGAFARRIVVPLAPAVTPEVAGSSPVAPVPPFQGFPAAAAPGEQREAPKWQRCVSGPYDAVR